MNSPYIKSQIERSKKTETETVVDQAKGRIGNFLNKFVMSRNPDDPLEIMKEIKAKIKKAEAMGAYADEEAQRLKIEGEKQFESALLKFHTRTADIGTLVLVHG